MCVCVCVCVCVYVCVCVCVCVCVVHVSVWVYMCVWMRVCTSVLVLLSRFIYQNSLSGEMEIKRFLALSKVVHNLKHNHAVGQANFKRHLRAGSRNRTYSEVVSIYSYSFRGCWQMKKLGGISEFHYVCTQMQIMADERFGGCSGGSIRTIH